MKTKIAPFLDEDGRLKQMPSKNAVRVEMYEYLSGKFECGVKYTEKEVNKILIDWSTTGDYFILRRGLVDQGLLGRTADGSEYWRIEKPENKSAKE